MCDEVLGLAGCWAPKWLLLSSAFIVNRIVNIKTMYIDVTLNIKLFLQLKDILFYYIKKSYRTKTIH